MAKEIKKASGSFNRYSLDLSYGTLQAIEAALRDNHSDPMVDEFYQMVNWYLTDPDNRIPRPGEDEEDLKAKAEAKKNAEGGEEGEEGGEPLPDSPEGGGIDDILPDPDEEGAPTPDDSEGLPPDANDGAEDPATGDDLPEPAPDEDDAPVRDFPTESLVREGLGKFKNGRHQPITPYKGSWADTQDKIRSGAQQAPKHAPNPATVAGGRDNNMRIKGVTIGSITPDKDGPNDMSYLPGGRGLRGKYTPAATTESKKKLPKGFVPFKKKGAKDKDEAKGKAKGKSKFVPFKKKGADKKDAKGKSIKQIADSLLAETGEWSGDEDDQAWIANMRASLSEIEQALPDDFKIKDIRGFDKYQGPYAMCLIRHNNEMNTYKIWCGDSNGDYWIEGFPVDNTSGPGTRAGFRGHVGEIIDMLSGNNEG